jgi:formamidopyrimidine-DNA glycosylase
MIELPEAAVLAGQVRSTLVGKRIASAAAAQTPHKFAFYTGDPAEYPLRLAGKTIQDASACAGHVEIFLGDLELAVSAPLRYHPAGEKRPARHQLLLEFNDGSALSVTIQMWGGIFCFPVGEAGGFWDYDHAKASPSPLSEAFDRACFDALFNAETGKLPAKAFLATEQRIPGLGNGVLQDILWTARIHPRRKMAELSAGEVTGMFYAVKDVLRAMTDQGGRDTERDLFGQPGGYRTVLSKNTAGQPCPVCGALIQKEAFLGGSIYFCPGCQARQKED